MFQDLAWAERGVDALKHKGLAVESLSILGKSSPELSAFIERQLGAPQSLDVKDLGAAVARGPLVAALQGADQGLGAARDFVAPCAGWDFRPTTAAFSTR